MIKNSAKFYFPSLDGLRSLACIGIVAMHVSANLKIKDVSDIGVVDYFISFAGNFVLLFMMVSAFSLCCGYLERFHNGSISLENFYSKRYKRILPFFALLTLIDVIKCVFENGFSFSNTLIGELWEAFANITLVFGLLPNNGIDVVGVGWFLGIIFLFYMLFPFYSVLLKKKTAAWLWLAVSLVWYVAIERYFQPINGAIGGTSCMLVVAPFFLVGGIAYIYVDKLKKLTENATLRNVIKVAIVCYSVAFFIFHFSFIFSNLLLYTMWLIYAIIDCSTRRKWTFLSNRVMAFISGISMEIYLSRMMFFRVIEKIHLANYFSNPKILYLTTLSVVVACTIFFACVWKKVEKRVVRKNT